MSDPKERTPSTLQQALVARVRAIPEGEVTKTARAIGFSESQMTRLRKGLQVNPTLETVERIARGMGIPAADLLDLRPGALARAQPRRSARERQSLDRLAKLLALASRLVKELAAE